VRWLVGLWAIVLALSWMSAPGAAARVAASGDDVVSASPLLAGLPSWPSEASGRPVDDAAAVVQDRGGGSSAEARWLWPFTGPRSVVAPFRAPSHVYGPGHRGMDVAGAGEVRSVADGVVAFRGVVVDRPLITVDHGGGLVATYEPVESTLAPGTPVRRGDMIGQRTSGGHAPPGALHLGVRRDGVYVDPLPFFAPAPRAVLLRCGGPVC